MNVLESIAEVYVTALRSLSKAEREAVLSRLLDDQELREDVMDLAVLRQRQGEAARPFREYLAEAKKPPER